MAPIFQAAGTAQTSIGTSVNVSWPTHLANDIGIIVIETTGTSATLTPPTGWAIITGTPVTDVATVAGSKLHVWWKRAASAAEAAVATGAATDHIIARIYTFRNVTTIGNPWNVAAVGTKTTASTTATIPTLTTTNADTLIVMVCGRPDDSASTTHFGVPVNVNLTGLAEAGEAGTIDGDGGGFVVSYGTKATAGSTGTSTLTKAASTTDTYVVLALKQAYTLDGTTQTYTWTRNNAILLENSLLIGEPSKYLIPTRNLVRYSEEFNNAYWAKQVGGTGLTPIVTTNDATAPDGTLTADKIVFDLNGGTTTTDRSDVSAGAATPTVIGVTYIFSVWLKTTDGSSLDFQLSHSTVSTSLVTVTGTWQRFTSTSNTAGDTLRRPRIGLRGASGTAAIASLHVWGFQHEVGTAITDYDPTTAVSATINNLYFQRIIDGTIQPYTVSSTINNLYFQRIIDGTTEPYTVSFTTTGLLKSNLLNAAVRSYNIVGINSSLDRYIPFNLTQANYNVVGNNALFNTTALLFTLIPTSLSLRLQSNGDFFWYRTTQTIPIIKPRLINRNQWILGRATHMGQRRL